MNYSTDDIYRLVGRDDKMAILYLLPNTESSENYGENLNVVFLYDKPTRERLEENHKNGLNETKFEYLRAKYLGTELDKLTIDKLAKTGINIQDISNLIPSPWPAKNVFHKKEIRSRDVIEIPLPQEEKGGHFDWLYGWNKKLRNEGALFFEYEMDFYLGLKYFYEPDSFTNEEKEWSFQESALKESIEKYYLDVKSEKELTNSDEEKRWEELFIKFVDINWKILESVLGEAGSSIAKLYSSNNILFKHLTMGTYKFTPHRLNDDFSKPIFLDWEGYLHIFTRHVKEFSIGEAFKEKDKFYWAPKDIESVIEHLIEFLDEEIQEFWKAKPNQRFSKYGSQSLYFEGDYYTLHVEGNGRLSTLHRSKTKI